MVLDLHDVWAYYAGRCALEGVSMHLAAGERIAVVGPNGAGKSTLFKVIAGILRPTGGTVQVSGSRSDRHVCIAYIEQQANTNARFPATVEDVVAMGRVARVRYFRYRGRRDRAIVADAMERVAITGLRRRQIGELSGGQRRRMFIARALAQEAEIMLLDEPYAGLDAEASYQLTETLDAVGESMAVMVATHDLAVAEHLGRVMLLNRRLIAAGAPRDVLAAEHLAAAYGNDVRRIGAGGGNPLDGAAPRQSIHAP
ncbi:MAG: metal ABC transporter ATP-binding protein [Spirochaetaceae bacterium]|nr:metal ABC transporter ATP-binding protein [Spirochaetaceae bacterium]